MNLHSYATAAVLSTFGFASADVLMDQIGDMDGTGAGTAITGCQDFETAYDIYDIVTADNFTGAGENITMVEMVMNGWNGFVDPSSVTVYTANIYSDASAAAVTLIGDIDSQAIDAADATMSGDWEGAGFLISVDTAMVASTGSQLVGLIPSNEFATGGQTGTANSLIGDNVPAWQANPGGGFGMPGNMQETDGDAAYRISTDSVIDPCDSPLPEMCTADVDGDMIVAVGDVLAIIGNWGECGDGTFRPVGDIAPWPNGDCCVNVSDLLEVIGSWGDDCTPRGACCSSAGMCSDDVTIDECLASVGEYLGDGSLCADGDCVAGACCIDDQTCIDSVSPWYCSDFGGAFRGADSMCADISCEANCQATGCQLADLGGHGVDGIIGATSDTNLDAGYIVADTFNTTVSGEITQACWWGMYIDFGGPSDCGADGPGTGDSFTISYYLDDASSNVPGTLHAGPFPVSASVNATGDVIGSSIGDIVQYEYSASHSPVYVESGLCYWISISNQTTATCYWLWETAPPGDGRSAQDNGGWGESDYDLAFCVDIEITPDGCGVTTGACCLVGDVCEILSATDCFLAEGNYIGDDVTCADANDCQPIPGACCFVDQCLDNTTDQDCIAFGGTFQGIGSLCSEIECAFSCPEGSEDDCDDCWNDGDDSMTDCNGGLNTPTPVYQAITLGIPICGTASVYIDGPTGSTYRDLDWYDNATLNAGGDFTLSVGSSGIDLMFGIVDLDAGAFVNLYICPGGQEMIETETLPAGNYSYICAPNEWNVLWTCSSGLVDYWVQLD